MIALFACEACEIALLAIVVKTALACGSNARAGGDTANGSHDKCGLASGDSGDTTKKACKHRAEEHKDEQQYSQGLERPEEDFCPICALPLCRSANPASNGRSWTIIPRSACAA